MALFVGGFGGGMGSATSSTINVGTFVLDMYDPATKQLVWTGNATKTIEYKEYADQIKELIQQPTRRGVSEEATTFLNPLKQRIVACGRALAAIGAARQFIDDGSCQ